MLRISMPITTAIPPDRQPVAGRLSASEVVTTPMSFTFSYVTHTLGAGTYYLVAGDDDVHVAAGRPVQPRASRDVHIADTIAHGALWLGGGVSDRAAHPGFSRGVTREGCLAAA